MSLFSGMNIVQRNVMSNLRYGAYETKEQLDTDLQDSIQALIELHTEAVAKLEKRNNCPHDDYNVGTNTVQRRVFGDYVTVHERSCKHCGKIESVTYDPEQKNEIPDWCKHTKNVYYNNNI